MRKCLANEKKNKTTSAHHCSNGCCCWDKAKCERKREKKKQNYEANGFQCNHPKKETTKMKPYYGINRT